MNVDYSLWELVAGASFIVKLVMVILLLASILSWTIILKKWNHFNTMRTALKVLLNRIMQGETFDRLYESSIAKRDFALGYEIILRNGFLEYLALQKQEVFTKEAVLANVERGLRSEVNKEYLQLDANLSILATIGSISPYIGLFGTVWGIMTSFRALGMAGEATLAMVAPGISEALIATAMGLFAAIPASLAYNRYTAHIQDIIAQYDNLTDDLLNFLHKKIFLT